MSKEFSAKDYFIDGTQCDITYSNNDYDDGRNPVWPGRTIIWSIPDLSLNPNWNHWSLTKKASSGLIRLTNQRTSDATSRGEGDNSLSVHNYAFTYHPELWTRPDEPSRDDTQFIGGCTMNIDRCCFTYTCYTDQSPDVDLPNIFPLGSARLGVDITGIPWLCMNFTNFESDVASNYTHSPTGVFQGLFNNGPESRDSWWNFKETAKIEMVFYGQTDIANKPATPPDPTYPDADLILAYPEFYMYSFLGNYLLYNDRSRIWMLVTEKDTSLHQVPHPQYP